MAWHLLSKCLQCDKRFSATKQTVALCTAGWQKGLSGEKGRKDAFITAVVWAEDVLK